VEAGALRVRVEDHPHRAGGLHEAPGTGTLQRGPSGNATAS
jgi:hypothetical protein